MISKRSIQDFFLNQNVVANFKIKRESGSVFQNRNVILALFFQNFLLKQLKKGRFVIIILKNALFYQLVTFLNWV